MPRASVPWAAASGQHGGEDGADARRPPEGEGHAHGRRREHAEAGRRDVQSPLLLQQPRRHDAGDEQAHDDGDDARDLVETPLVVDERLADGAGAREQEREHEREAGDEQQRRPQHPPPVVGRRLDQLARADARHQREVAGHQRQHARRQERQHPAAEGDDEPERARCGRARPRPPSSILLPLEVGAAPFLEGGHALLEVVAPPRPATAASTSGSASGSGATRSRASLWPGDGERRQLGDGVGPRHGVVEVDRPAGRSRCARRRRR